MRLRILIALLCLSCLLGAGVASAQQDLFCVCLDPEEPLNCGGSVDADFLSHVILYLAITDFSNTQVKAWEAMVEVSNEYAWVGNWVLLGGTNFGSPPEFIVGAGASPLTPNSADVVALMSIDLLILDVSDPIEIFIRGVPGSLTFPDGPGYAWEAGFPVPCTPCSGDPEIPVFAINGDIPTPTFFNVQIDATSGGISDEGNRAGADLFATDGYDSSFDIPEPPPAPADYVSLYFPHPEWGSPFGDDFMTDIRAPYPANMETGVWPFVVETDLVTMMTLEFTPDVGVESGWDIWLHDPVAGWVIDLRDAGWVFEYMPAGGAREFELWIGPGEPGPIPPFRDLPSGWSLIGMPVIPPTPGTIESAILQDAGGTTFVYDHDPGQGYVVLDPGDQAYLGTGYWVGATQGFTWEIPNGTTFTDPIWLNLINGWNMIGYPLWRATHTSGVNVERYGLMLSWDEAVSMGWITEVFYDYDTALEDYVTTDDFQPWYGYWVAAHTNGVALVFYHEDIVPPALAPRSEEMPADTDWRLEVAVDDGSTPIAFGFREKSTDGFDARYDLPSPPRAPAVEPAAKLRFEHPEWNLAVGDAFITDFRPPVDPPYRWDAVLTSPEPGPVVLSWDRSVLSRDQDLQVYLPHQNRVVVMSMFEASSVTLEVGDEPLQVTFRSPDLMTDVSDLPQRHEIACHPNPFNPVTEIELRTVSAGEVALEIYDLRGRQVRTFALGVQAAGTYPVTWRGRDDAGRELAGGTYFAMLVLDGECTGAMAKLTLVR